MSEIDQELESVVKLNRDLRVAARSLSESEARYLVDLYYTTQANRIRAAAQIREADNQDEPNLMLQWAFHNFKVTEDGVLAALLQYVRTKRVGEWMLSIHGIGPVIAAGLLAHIDIERAPTAGHIWRFAGLDPSVKWERKTRRPWNAELKVLCWKAGQSFMKQRASKKDIYGKVYEQRKAFEVERNESGGNESAAKAQLEAKKFRKNQTRECLEAGRLSPAQIDARARRYAVKLFLAHLQHVMWEDRYGEPPVKPYVLSHLDHVHYIAPPGWSKAA